MHRSTRKIAVTLLSLHFFVGGSALLSAQFETTDSSDTGLLSIDGDVRISTDFYHAAGEEQGRERPSPLLRLHFNPTLSIGEAIELPFRFQLSSAQTNVTTPRLEDQSFAEYLRNPMNTIGFAPRYRWATLLLGSQVLEYSALTTGDVQTFGIGARLEPGKLSVEGFYGKVGRSSREEQTYAQDFLGGRVAWGEKEKVGVSVARLQDDTASASGLYPEQQAAEVTNVSLGAEVKIAKELRFEGEVAGALVTRSIASEESDREETGFLDPIGTVRYSSRADVSGEGRLRYDGSSFDADLHLRYVGDGYRAAGYPYLASDRLEGTISPSLLLLDDKVSLAATLGVERTNLSGTKESSANHLLASIDADAQITPSLGIGFGYANFGLRTRRLEDTARIEMTSHTLSFAPRYSFGTGSKRVSLSSGISWDRFVEVTDRAGVSSPDSVDVEATTVNAWLSGSLRLLPSGASLGVTVDRLDYRAAGIGTESFGVSIRVARPFFERRLLPSLSIGYRSRRVESAESTGRLTLRGTAHLRFTPEVSLRVHGGVNSEENRSELFLRTSIGYRF